MNQILDTVLRRRSISQEISGVTPVTNNSNFLVKQFNDLNIEIYGDIENPLFKAHDIGDILGIKDILSSIKGFDKDEQDTIRVIDALGRMQETKMLTEQGLYKCIFKSRKKFALDFQKWVYSVIKEIRLKGRYDL